MHPQRHSTRSLPPVPLFHLPVRLGDSFKDVGTAISLLSRHGSFHTFEVSNLLQTIHAREWEVMRNVEVGGDLQHGARNIMLAIEKATQPGSDAEVSTIH